MQRYWLHGRTLSSELPLPELERAPVSAHATCAIRMDREAERAAPSRWYRTWTVGEQRPWLLFGRCGNAYLLRFPDLADFQVSARGDCIDCRPRRNLPAATLRHLLLDQVLPLVLSRSTAGLVLHASAASVPRAGTVAFLGPSGAGKSTLIAALQAHGCSIVTDDCLSVIRSGSGFDALPGYSGLRLWPDTMSALGTDGAAGSVAHYSDKKRITHDAVVFESLPTRLCGVFQLAPRRQSGRRARSRPLRARVACMAMVRFAYLLDTGDPRELTHVLEAAAAVAATVPAARLAVLDDTRALHATAEAVIAEARRLCADTGA